MVGDKPMDRFYLCLKNLADDYADRFDRKPTVAEVLYAMNLSIQCHGDAFFSDPESVPNLLIAINNSSKKTIASYDGYEAAYVQTDDAEHYVVEGPNGDVVMFPRFDIEGDILYCDFKRIDPDLSAGDVKGLVFVTILGTYLRRSYVGKVNTVEFTDLDSGEKSRKAYPG